MKLAICGPGRAGKDVAAEWLAANTTLRYWGGTSQLIAPVVAERQGISVEAAMARRHLDREYWAAIGDEMCRHDPAALARRVLEKGDIVVGRRRLAEVQVVRDEGLVDLIVWIDRPGTDPDPSLRYGPNRCDVMIRNAGTIRDYHAKLRRLAAALGVMRVAAPLR